MSAGEPAGRRPRVLCLHGNGTSASIMRVQLGHLQRTGAGELTCIDGPTECPPAPGITPHFPEGPYYRFCERAEGEGTWYKPDSVARGLAHVRAKWAELGPFDALLGFSQGANVAAMLAAEHAGGHALPGLRCVVLLCGCEGGWRAAVGGGFAERPVPLPSLHLAGEQDSLRPLSDRLLLMFTESGREQRTHSAGHRPFPGAAAEAREHAGAVGAFLARHCGAAD
eukprot:TRINITY_DN46046_c0_g1_i1.p2 TRINITY_DN46046_c0_g1~~TRINITY_DN46046_c0_g1_i1.p2  ORF type:complete len:245 (+),score=70.71 TRINITY_DN46046_c0_g1_i1:62-736(+)